MIEQIEEAKHICSDPVFAVEQKVDLSFHVKDCFGTADMVIVTDKKVHIIDLKLGKGVQVDAEKNTQLMIYGLGMLDIAEMLFDIETVELSIVQPRISHFSTWEISAEELHQWAEQEFEPKAKMALDGEGEYKAGEWCRFCKARFQCRARAEEYLHLAQMEFSQPALLSDEEIAEVLSKADALKKWAEEIYTYAQNEAITNRKEWPGFKLVLGRSNRKYSDEEEVAEAAKTAGYTDIYRTSLISITEMEKLMGKKKFNEILGSYVYKPDGKVTLVPDSDKREAIYLHAFEPDSINGSDPKYSVSLIIDKKDTDLIAKIKKAVEQAKEDGKSKWGGKIPANLKLPLRDGDLDRPEDEAYAGAYFINANSKQAPQVVDRNVQPILDQSELYSGCYIRASVTFYAYNSNGNKGIAAGLGNIQKVRDGEPLGSRVNAKDEFDAVDGEDDFLA